MPNSHQYHPGEQVELKILRETDLGFVAEINGVDEGLLYHNEIFEILERGQVVPGYIKEVRSNGTIDLLLQPFGNKGAEELGARILEELKANKGFLPMNSKASTELIYNTFGVSKKKYKIAIGGLYKKRLITITDDGIQLVPIATASAKPEPKN
jgi:uncharacterized protein